jgi:hypothetical protein
MQRRATKNTRGPTTDEKRFQGWLKEQVCCVTGEYGVQVHHCVGSAAKHNKERIGHWFCIPLSVEMHAEYHAGTKAFREKYGPQSMLWIELLAEYSAEMHRCYCPAEIEAAIMDLRK